MKYNTWSVCYGENNKRILNLVHDKQLNNPIFSEIDTKYHAHMDVTGMSRDEIKAFALLQLSLPVRKRVFYGFEFTGGNRTCTEGDPNEKTGRMNIAGWFTVFTTRKGLDKWLEKSQSQTVSFAERIVVTKKELRKLCLGLSVKEFEELVEDETEYKTQISNQ